MYDTVTVCLVCTRALARLYGWDCWVPPVTYELVLCDVKCGQVFTDSICITKAWEAVSCGQVCAVRGCECQMNNEQPKVVVTGTQSCGVGTSVNKEYWKIKAASNSRTIFLEKDQSNDELQIAVTEVGQVRRLHYYDKFRPTQCNSRGKGGGVCVCG